MFLFLQAPCPAAFSPSIQLLSSVAAAEELRALPSRAPEPDPEERPGENGQTSLGTLQAGEHWGGVGAMRGSALLCSERRRKRLCWTSHFALKKTDLSF